MGQLNACFLFRAKRVRNPILGLREDWRDDLLLRVSLADLRALGLRLVEVVIQVYTEHLGDAARRLSADNVNELTNVVAVLEHPTYIVFFALVVLLCRETNHIFGGFELRDTALGQSIPRRTNVDTKLVELLLSVFALLFELRLLSLEKFISLGSTRHGYRGLKQRGLGGIGGRSQLIGHGTLQRPQTNTGS